MMPPPPLPRPPARWAIFLDIDGTLIDIAPTPAQAQGDDALVALVGHLHQGCAGALAVITGRSIAMVDTLFAPLRLPIAGLHGLERRRGDGSMARLSEAPEALAWLRPRLAAYAAQDARMLLEDKGASLALHYRLAPERGGALRTMARRLAAEAGLRLIEGDKVVEFQGPGADKGQGIAAFLEEAPFRGRTPVFAGDDTTDEDGFRVVTELGGIAIKVGARRGVTSARYRLADVAAMRRWLGEAAAILGQADAPAAVGTAPLDSVLS